MKNKEVKKILIIGHRNIGDACYDLVVVKPLRRKFKDAEIVFLTSPVSRGIVEGYKGLDRVIIFDKYGADKGIWGRLRLMSLLIEERFDLAVALSSTLMHKYIKAGCQWSVRKYLGCLPQDKKMHVADIYIEFLRSFGVEAEKEYWDFDVEAGNNFCDEFLKKAGVSKGDKIAGILPYSGWPLKDWPIDKWNVLGDLLNREYNFKVIALGRVADDISSKEKLTLFSPSIISAVNKTTLKQAVSLIKRCNLFIGVDSSLLHLASCMGVESIGLFGATSKEYIYPYFHYCNVITPAQKRYCMPCYPGLNPCPCMKDKITRSPCMDDISVESVMQLVKQKEIRQ
ncbi:MAG: glycosyltransferase family 9 protein [Candidatus Omnitrophota bacterium]|jgi:ADP-heptose:LPS heptosyltransferase